MRHPPRILKGTSSFNQKHVCSRLTALFFARLYASPLLARQGSDISYPDPIARLKLNRPERTLIILQEKTTNKLSGDVDSFKKPADPRGAGVDLPRRFMFSLDTLTPSSMESML